MNGLPCEFWYSPKVIDALIPSMTIRDILFHLPRLGVCNKLSSFPHMSQDPLKILAEKDDDDGEVGKAQWFITGKNRDVSTGPLVRPFARSLAPFTFKIVGK